MLGRFRLIVLRFSSEGRCRNVEGNRSWLVSLTA
jgi:hypothetical protein